MRTKTLIMTAALSAAGVATSMAQVYSVNAVGYVNTALKPGYNLISNPLRAADDSIAALFGSSLPNNTKVYTFDGTKGFTIFTYLTAGGGRWLSTDAAVTAATMMVHPGDGVFVKNPLATDVAVTFVGEVDQGTGTALNNAIPSGLSIKSSRVPQEGTTDLLGFPAVNGDSLYTWDPATQAYTVHSRNAGRWFPTTAPVPALKVGEAMFVKKATATTWTRDFVVSP